MEIYKRRRYSDDDYVTAEQCGEATVYRLSNPTGKGTVTAHRLFDSLYIMFDDIHMARFSEDSDAFPMLTIEHCREGRFECTLGDGSHGYLGPGDVCVHYIAYSDIAATSFPLRHYHGLTIMMEDVLDDELAAAFGAFGIDVNALAMTAKQNGGIYFVRATEEADHILGELYRMDPAASRGYFRLKTLELLLFLARQEEFRRPVKPVSVPAETVGLIRAVEEYMWRNLDRSLTVRKLSEMFGLSATSLKSHFKSVFGMPVCRYLHECRMQVAACRLVGTEDKIADVARGAGYRNAAKFSAAFKEFSGVSPREYRKNKTLSDWSINTASRV